MNEPSSRYYTSRGYHLERRENEYAISVLILAKKPGITRLVGAAGSSLRSTMAVTCVAALRFVRMCTLSLSLSLFSSLCLNVCMYACCVCVSHSRVVGSRQDPIDGATGVVGRG